MVGKITKSMKLETPLHLTKIRKDERTVGIPQSILRLLASKYNRQSFLKIE